MDAWCTDFRADVPAPASVPTLVVQGTKDRILPIDATERRLPPLVPGLEYHEIEEGPHNIGWTHAEALNPLFLDFLAKQAHLGQHMSGPGRRPPAGPSCRPRT